MLSVPAPTLVAFSLSAAVAFGAWRLRSLSTSGAIAAGVAGVAALCASWGMGCYLVAWFVLATLLSKVGKHRKAERVSGIVEKSSERDAWQVLANGGVYFVCCVVVIFVTAGGVEATALLRWVTIAAGGALAASGADTWATEVGTLFGGAPWSVRSRSRVPAGTSGAITWPGTVAMIVGALVLAIAAAAFGVTQRDYRTVLAIGAGGTVGAFADTLIGAWLQERRWCPRCTEDTEQAVHRCGTPTVHHRGVSGLNNDGVNLLCSVIGAVTAALAGLL